MRSRWKFAGLVALLLAGGPAARADDAPPPEPKAPTPEKAPDGVEALLGRWGGKMSATKLKDTLFIEQADVDVGRSEDGSYVATVHMDFTVVVGETKARVLADGAYAKGRVDGSTLRFDTIKFKRTIPSTGATNEIDGNALNLRRADDGRLDTEFVGEGGFTLSLVRKPTEAAPASGIDALVGSWGGSMGSVDIGSGVKLDELYLDVSRAEDGTWIAVTKMHTTVPAGGGMKVDIDVRQEKGVAKDGAVHFEKTPWHRLVISTGQKDDIVGNPLTIRVAENGGLAGRFEGDDGMPFTLARRKR